eukprot:362429_1
MSKPFDIEYLRLESDEIDVLLSEKLKWLNKWISVLPTWSSISPSHKRRPTILNYIILFVTIVWIICDYSYAYYMQIYIYSDNFSLIANVFYSSLLFLTMISRFTSLYYFYFRFNWPWIYQSFGFHVYVNYNKTKVQRYIQFSRLLFILIICIDITSGCSQLYFKFTSDFNEWFRYSNVVEIFMFRIFILYPLFVLLMVQSSVFIKYYLYLSQIVHEIRCNSKLKIQLIFEQYDKIQKQFKIDYSTSLQMAVQLFLAAELLYAWDTLYIAKGSPFGWWKEIVEALLVFAECAIYISTASLLTECHNQFETLLWCKGKDHLIVMTGNSEDKICYNYTLQYVQKYPLVVKIGSFALTKWNTCRLLLVFALTKVLTYTFKDYLYGAR